MNFVEIQSTSSSCSRTSQDLCRMSWFLIEIDEGLYNGDKAASGNITYITIHAVDLIDDDMSDMYISRRVQFSQQQNVLEGKVVLASDDRRYVEEQMRSMRQVLENGLMPQQSIRYFLVQYNKSNNSVIHAIVQSTDVSWPLCDLARQRELVIKVGQEQHLSIVLYTDEQEALLQEELQKLKSKCFEQVFDESDDDTHMHDELSLLVQYSCNPKTVIYAIVKYTETVWHADNLYRDVVTYLSDGSAIFQCIIIRKSIDRCELDAQLHKLKDCARQLEFPQQKEAPFLWDNGLQLRIMEEVAREHTAMDDELELLDKQMQREVTMLADAFEAIEHARQTMDKRMLILNNQ